MSCEVTLSSPILLKPNLKINHTVNMILSTYASTIVQNGCRFKEINDCYMNPIKAFVSDFRSFFFLFVKEMEASEISLEVEIFGQSMR